MPAITDAVRSAQAYPDGHDPFNEVREKDAGSRRSLEQGKMNERKQLSVAHIKVFHHELTS